MATSWQSYSQEMVFEYIDKTLLTFTMSTVYFSYCYSPNGAKNINEENIFDILNEFLSRSR